MLLKRLNRLLRDVSVCTVKKNLLKDHLAQREHHKHRCKTQVERISDKKVHPFSRVLHNGLSIDSKDASLPR